MPLEIIVTPDESKVIDEFASSGVKITLRPLDVGDIQIERDGSVVYIFERKAGNDLSASINDGRYRDQKGRLIDTALDRRHIVYIIEALRPGTPAAWGAICNTYHRDGLGVFQTRNVAETVRFITGIAKAIEKFDGQERTPVNRDVNVNIKKRSVSKGEWFNYSLTLIPGVSKATADAIVAEYPTISDLVTAINEGGYEVLRDLSLGKRRLGPKLSQRICEVVYENY